MKSFVKVLVPILAVGLMGTAIAVNQEPKTEYAEYQKKESSKSSKSESSKTEEVVQAELAPQVQPQPVQQVPATSYAGVQMMTTREERALLETGMDYNANLNGTYIGAYGFYRPTWESEAAEAKLDPTDFSPANQDAMADYHAQKHYDGYYGAVGSGW